MVLGKQKPGRRLADGSMRFYQIIPPPKRGGAYGGKSWRTHFFSIVRDCPFTILSCRESGVTLIPYEGDAVSPARRGPGRAHRRARSTDGVSPYNNAGGINP